MDPARKGLIWRLARWTAYIVVLGLLFQAQQGVDWRRLFSRTPTAGAPPNTLILAGDDLAPDLMARLVDAYRRDFPRVHVERRAGGTRAALEELVNRRCDVALTLRPVTGDEQALFVEATGDSALAVPFALGGLVLLRGAAVGGSGAPDAMAASDREAPASGQPRTSLDRATLENLATGRPTPGIDRFYVPDPNDGLWAAFLAQLAPGQPDTLRPEGVVFLADPAAVREAVRADPRSIGLASSLSLPENSGASGVQPLALYDASTGTPVDPTYENIGNARYPLFHYLYAVSRPGGGLEGSMFITHLTSSRGQRQIERFGFLPARQALRPVVLSSHPVGDTP
jgi:ABC-type phosphate transport system substrate-binding protein